MQDLPHAQTRTLDMDVMSNVGGEHAPREVCSDTTDEAASRTSLRSDTSDQEHVGNAFRLRKALKIGALVWPLFVLADLAMQRFAFPDASRLWLISVRAAVWSVLIGGIVRLGRPRSLSARQLVALDALTFGSAAFATSVLCVSFGGFTSHYAAGIPVVLICRAGLVHMPWRTGAIPAGICALSYPLTQLSALAWSPLSRAQLHDPAALTLFCVHNLGILVTLVLAVFAGHSVWALRRQLFEARIIDRYRLVRPLGRGGMGEVWVARHAMLQREFALKLLRADRLHDPIAQRRFGREVQAMMELTHPNTVRVFDYGTTDDGLLYYAMELLSGQDLATLVASHGPMDAAAVVQVMLQVCAAVAEAHARGIVHRDLKPENIFLCAQPTDPTFAKVLDFGIAKRTDAASEPALTQGERAVGTPAYMSPEVALGKPVDARSDVYGLGAVMYFMLAGVPPFAGRTSAAVMLAHLREEPLPPSAARKAPLPPALESVVLRCLAKAPEQRYACAATLLRALSELGI